MNYEKILELEELFLELETNLCILKSAVICYDEDLQVSDLVNFVKGIYEKSEEIRKIFSNY